MNSHVEISSRKPPVCRLKASDFRLSVAALLIIVSAAVCTRAQAPTAAQEPSPAPAPAQAPRLEIVSPVDKEYVSGPIVLTAQLDPPEAASAVIFFVDGRQLCVVTSEPFECEWDAGRSVAEHQIRV